MAEVTINYSPYKNNSMKISKLIILVSWFLLFSTRFYAQDFQQYVHLLTKAEATTGATISSCTCYRNIQWKQASATMTGFTRASDKTSASPTVKPTQTEVYDLYESISGSLVLRERHTVAVIDVRILIREGSSVFDVMADRTITFIGKLENIGNFRAYPDLTNTSIIKNWVLTAASTTTSQRKQYDVMSNISLIEKSILTQNDNITDNRVNSWIYTYSVNLKGKNCLGAYERTITSPNSQPINVYKLLITQFRDKTTKKEWKVVVGKDIEKSAVAMPSITNFMWEMPDVKLDPLYPLWREQVWHIQNSGSNFLKIPLTDLQQNPISMDNSRVKNDDLGENKGTIKVSCMDALGNMHVMYSRNPPVGSVAMITPKAAKVYFERDNDLLGNTTVGNETGDADETGTPPPPINVNKPLWFIFWKEGGVVGLLNDVKYRNDQANIAGRTTAAGVDNIQVWVYSITVRRKEGIIPDITEVRDAVGVSPRRNFKYGSQGNHVRSLIGTITHENYHKAILLARGWSAGTYRDGGTFIIVPRSDTDNITDNEEIVPGSIIRPGSTVLETASNSDLPRSDSRDKDTYNLVSNMKISATYNEIADQELRCRIVQYKTVSNETLWRSHYVLDKDWSAVAENSNW